MDINNDNFLDTIKAQNSSLYASVNKDFLLAYAISLLIQQRIPTTFEMIVVTCFKLFPKSFALIGFPNYPDAARINRALLHARPNYQNLVVGDAKRGYRLTKKGMYKAEEVQELLQRGNGNRKELVGAADNIDRRTYRGKEHIERVDNSKLYKLWREGKDGDADPYELWFFLDMSPSTDRGTLNHILDDFDRAAKVGERDDIVKFLSWLRRKYSSQLRKG